MTQNGRLRFKKFNQLDAGEYTCSQNEKIEKFDLTMINKNGIEGHSFLKAANLAKKPGGTIEQVCTATSTGFSLPESLNIQWFNSDGQVIFKKLIKY